MIRQFIYSTLLVLAVASASGKATDSIPFVEYHVTFDSGAVDITADWPALQTDSAIFTLPPWGGVEDFYRDIRDAEARTADGKIVGRLAADSAAFIVTSANAPFRLSYRIVCRKQSFAGDDRKDVFRATVLSDMAFVWGTAAFLMPGDSSLDTIRCRLRLDRGPYAMAATSADTGAILQSLDRLRDCLLIAGDYRAAHRKVGDIDLNFYFYGTCAFTDTQFTSTVERILRAQISYLGTYPLRRQTVVVVPGTPSSSGGSVASGVIAVYPDPTDSLQGETSSTLHLISHEHFHVWAEKLRLNPIQPEGYYKWFSEGFADYYASLTMYCEGLLSDSGFVQAVNLLIRLYYGNPYAFTFTADSNAVAYWRNGYANHLPYHKGALIALLMDVGIIQSTSGTANLDGYLRRLISIGVNRREGLNDSLLLGALDSVSREDWSHFYGRYMLGSPELPLEDRLGNAGWTLARDPIAVYSLGFRTSTGEMAKGLPIAEVLQASSASEAGLRVGDTLVGWGFRSNDTTFPVDVRVLRGGEKLAFHYLPITRITAPQIVFDSTTRIAIRRLFRSPNLQKQ